MRKSHWLFYALTGIMICATAGTELMAAEGEKDEPKPVKLFNGKNLEEWKALHPDNNAWTVAKAVTISDEDKAKFEIIPGEGIMVNGEEGRTTNIISQYQHGDCKLHIEFVVPHNSNSGVYFQGLYEIQVLDSYGKKDEDLQFSDCGAIYARYKDGETFEGHPPRTNASKAPGEWQEFEAIFRAPRFNDEGEKIENARFIEIKHNGVVIHENVELTGNTRASLNQPEAPKGPLMLQGDHGPVAYRNIILTPLELDCN